MLGMIVDAGLGCGDISLSRPYEKWITKVHVLLARAPGIVFRLQSARAIPPGHSLNLVTMMAGGGRLVFGPTTSRKPVPLI